MSDTIIRTPDLKSLTSTAYKQPSGINFDVENRYQDRVNNYPHR